jgi:ribosomal protein S18 acetylase RimI-like enzyme
MAAIAELMQGLAAMLAWPKPLRLRKLGEADVEPLAAMIVAVLAEFSFPWLATEAQRQEAREGKARNLRHSLRLCAEAPDGNALWVLEHTGGEAGAVGAPVFRLVGSVGIRRAAAAGNGTGWGERPAELPTDSSTAELHALYLHPSLRGRKLGLRLYDTAEAFAKACGYSSIWLESVARFAASKALYERNGFATIDRIDNKYEDEIMVKSIAPVTGAVVGPATADAQAGRAAAAGALGGSAAPAAGAAAGALPYSRASLQAAAELRPRARLSAFCFVLPALARLTMVPWYICRRWWTAGGGKAHAQAGFSRSGGAISSG